MADQLDAAEVALRTTQKGHELLALPLCFNDSGVAVYDDTLIDLVEMCQARGLDAGFAHDVEQRTPRGRQTGAEVVLALAMVTGVASPAVWDALARLLDSRHASDKAHVKVAWLSERDGERKWNWWEFKGPGAGVAQSMRWESSNALLLLRGHPDYLLPDGGDREICVMRTSVRDWQRLLDALPSWKYEHEMILEFPNNPPVKTAKQIFRALHELGPDDPYRVCLSVRVGSFWLAALFFTTREIEFHFYPQDMNVPEDVAELKEFLSWLANVTRKPAKLTMQSGGLHWGMPALLEAQPSAQARPAGRRLPAGP